MGVMMVGLDGTIVAVANPAIQSHLHASLAGIQWISNAYLLALAVSLIPAGKAGDRFGHKKVFLTGVAGFAASSAAIGLAGSMTLVIAFRALQGVFGAMLQPTALALLRRTFPPGKLNGAIGVWGAVIGASTAAGPIVGGLLVQHLGWEACFYVNVPVGAAALIMSLLVLRETPAAPASSFDIPAIAALSGALFTLIWGLIKGPDYGWGSPRTLAFLGAAALLGLLFVVRERRARQPLLPLKLFRSASVSAGVVLVILLMFALFGAMFFMTFYLENVHGLSPVAAGVHLLPMTAILIIGSPIAGTLISRTGPRLPIVAGMTMAAAAMFGLSHLGATASPNDTIIWFVLLGLGLAPVMVGATNVIVGNAPRGTGRRGRRAAIHRHAARRHLRHRRARRHHVRQDRQPAPRELARRAPAPADRGRLRPGQKRGHGRGGASALRHPGAGGRCDHPDQPRHVHRRNAQRLPDRRRRRPRRSQHRPDHQQRHRHRRRARRHLTQPAPSTAPEPEGRTSCPPCSTACRCSGSCSCSTPPRHRRHRRWQPPPRPRPQPPRLPAGHDRRRDGHRHARRRRRPVPRRPNRARARTAIAEDTATG
jgi:EmrB/QacA subfamily drug resistance transporter